MEVYPDCKNASNPYHECSEYCFKIIAEAKIRRNKSDTFIINKRRVHPDCRNASNPYHECSEYCFKIIADTKKRMNKRLQANDDNVHPNMVAFPNQPEDVNDGSDGCEEHSDEEAGMDGGDDTSRGFANLTGRQKKLFELRLKMNEAKKSNQTAMVAEKKKLEAPVESRGISKQKWLEERKKKIGKLLDANGLDMSKAYMLDTRDGRVKKRTKNIEVDHDEYNRMKEVDPEFYREASSLQYGKAPNISEEKIERMVKELKDREEKSRSFSRRRKYREEKDIDSINDRNEHFNKKIERAFGKYTLEIKNNLERGTALPD
ncbi:hypothetical protein Pfo_002937 [Paulownia fortunei]|nr:hypothetical protein Pfo_002937 [Paulownia fortunei]